MIRLAKKSDAESIIEIKKEIILSKTTSKFLKTSPNKITNNVNKEREYRKVVEVAIYT